VLRVWTDSSRWQALVAHLDGDPTAWLPDSRRVWEQSFQRWSEVRPRLLAHARGIHQEFLPPRAGAGRYAVVCREVVRLLDSRRGRYHEWVRAVAEAVAVVDQAAGAAGGLADTGKGRAGEARARLEALARAARHLKEVFSGRGWFNPTHSD
jgi:hypothetical protein